MSDENIIEELTDALEKIISNMRVNQHTTPKTALWDKNDCANYLRISVSTLDKMNDFISPRLSISGKAQGNRWIAQDVIDWAQSKQFTAGRPRAA